MTWRRAALYWACCLTLGAYYVGVERQPVQPAAAHVTRAPFLSVAMNEIEGLDLQRGAAVVRCRRVAGRWQVVEPAGSTVPADLVTALVANVTQLPDVEVVAETATDLRQFGLDAPVAQLVLTPTGGPPITVRVGTLNPAGTAVYAQVDQSPRILLVGLNIRYYTDLVFEAVRPVG
jgi:hypothetical protein